MMKRLVVFCDGTWNKPDRRDRGKRKPSNIVKLARGLLPEAADGTPQIASYDEGVGTHWGLDRFLGGGFGHGLSKNLIQAYRFLVHNYQDQDHIFLFGFSRGAYTIRSLAGFLHKMGLLPKDHDFYTPDAYGLYARRAPQAVLKEFRAQHGSRPVHIRFLGVFDTVGALGIPVTGLNRLTFEKYRFHEVELPPMVDNAFHALAIDERRKPFRPSLWPESADGQRMEQVWFPGVHTNIGGGYEKDGLANGPLHWMKAKAAECGLEWDEEFLQHYRPWFGDELRENMTLMYRMMGQHLRPIGEVTRGSESVDDSALKRRDRAESRYEAPNLETYLRSRPP